MADLLLPFDPQRVCPACGAEFPSPVFHAAPVLVVFSGPQWPCAGLDGQVGAHLCLRCGCGFACMQETSEPLA